MKEISVLCVNKNSIYKKLGVDCYDENRDVFTFNRPVPVIAHPPCRCFSKMRSFVKTPASDFKIARYVYQHLQVYGGILEQPAGSKMREYLGLGCPLYLDQFWFGYPIRKPTWLWFFGDARAGSIPLSLNPSLHNTEAFELMSKNQRSATPLGFAQWLINSIGGTYV